MSEDKQQQVQEDLKKENILLDGCKVVLCDVAGTTTSLNFVKVIMFFKIFEFIIILNVEEEHQVDGLGQV